MANEVIAKKLHVNGIVQGVGFRPFVFQLAEKHELKGEVANTSSGVIIHVEGQAAQIAAFEKAWPYGASIRSKRSGNIWPNICLHR